MNQDTLKLCYYASELYESKKLSSNDIYQLLTTTNRRIGEVTKARQLVSYFLYNHYKMTMVQIAKEFKLQNHSSIIYQIDKVFYSLRTDKRMKYRHDFMLDIINGVQRIIMRDRPISKGILSEDDKEFIKANLSNDFSVSYYADILSKTKGAVKFYLYSLNKETLNATRKPQVKLSRFVIQKIDY
jgi:hypothetical protein